MLRYNKDMSRPYLLQSEDCFYHVTSRGDDRKRIFLSERDYHKFIEYISYAKAKYKFHVYAYCLMPNHYHLLLETTQANISKIMHYLNGSYTMYYNIKRKRSGHLFQGRFKSIVVDKDSYFQELSRYIHLNPVKAKITKQPEAYRWSSYRGYFGKQDQVLDYDRIKQYLGMDKNQYRQFVLSGLDKSVDPFKNTYAGFLLGSAQFIKEKLQSLRDQVESRYHQEAGELYAAKKKPVFARKAAIYLAKKLTCLSNVEIGTRFGITYSAVSKAAGDIERLRQEDKKVNREVEELISHFKG